MENNKLGKHAVQVHKFGGSSLASIECIERVIAIIQRHCQINDVVVVSASGDTTDDLIEIYQHAKHNSDQLHQAISTLKNKQQALIEGLLSTESATRLLQRLEQDFQLLAKWLQIDIAAHESELLAFGEVWSANLLSAVLAEKVCPSHAIDAREFLVIDNEQSCQVDFPLSESNLAKQRVPNKLAIVTGFIAKNSDGIPCTLGRNGSDYSATILAALTQAQDVTLWTDVDGIYSADPRVVPLARKLHRVPRTVAKELGRLGNPVLHAKTLLPLEIVGSHLHVASSFDPKTAGTEVGDFGQIAQQELSVTYQNDLLLAESESFIGEPGTLAYEKFTALSGDLTRGQIVIRLDQQRAVSEWLASDTNEVKFTPISIMAVVGDNVAKRGNVKARFKRALKHQIPLAIFDQLHINSLVAALPNACTGETLNNIHHDVTKDSRHIGVVVAGLGNIGQRFIEMLPKQLARVSTLENTHLVGLVTSKKMLIQSDGIDAEHALAEFEHSATAYEEQELLTWLANHPYDELVMIDITPSEAFSQLYERFFSKGIHVISANKWAASASLAEYRHNIALANKHEALWLGSTTVGAGLQINYAIKDLRQSGDTITEISGIFSGTLSWLFQKYNGEVPFSELLRQALADGLTEPDPREDLSGRDVQRKLLILARTAGFELSLEDVEVENLVPAELAQLSLPEFLAQAEQLNQPFLERLNAAREQQACIRYVARFSAQDDKIVAKVSLETLPLTDAFAALTPCDNIFKIVSHWYLENPLIIRGPGAGRDVTAGGLHSDLVNICQQLMHKQHQVKLKGIN
ncbi:bifunctional aspartate kinase/homoserine dehydrogenase II [Colwellia sp. MEBiC06753]